MQIEIRLVDLADAFPKETVKGLKAFLMEMGESADKLNLNKIIFESRHFTSERDLVNHLLNKDNNFGYPFYLAPSGFDVELRFRSK